MHPNANCNCRYADVGCDKMEEVMDQISGKWKMRILFMVGAHGTLRYGELRRLRAEGMPLVIYEPTLKEDTFYGDRVEKDLDKFKAECDVILANRAAPELADVAGKVYTRDLYSRD